MELLAFLGFAAVIIMLVGHGLWVVVAWFFRGGRSAKESMNYEPTVAEDRTATFRYLDHLRVRRVIDQESYAHLTRLISEDAQSEHPQSIGVRARDNPVIWPIQHPRTETERSQSPQPMVTEELRPSPPVATPVLRKESVEWVAPQIVPPVPEPEPIVPIESPRRPFAEVLAGFMAEKNIRWGELVGGLLIVGCSIALVVSLWSQIAAIPILKFIIFTVVTAGLFGTGLFVHHRWKLPATGHALLVTSTLLVPLNILAFAAFSAPGAQGGYSLVAELVALALFGWLTFRAGRVLMPTMPALFAGGIAGLSATSLGVRYLSLSQTGSLLAGSLIPVGAYAAIMAVSMRNLARGPRITEESARALIMLLSLVTFACLVPLGLLVHQSVDAGRTLRSLSPVLCLLAIPSNVLGMTVWRRLDENAGIRVAAATISLTAAGVMMLAACLAWPMPLRLVPTLILNAATMMAMSRILRHPGFHVGAMAWLTLAWIVGFHSVIGHVAWSETLPHVVVAAWLSATTGKAMIPIVLSCLLIAEWLRRQGSIVASAYVMTGTILGGISAGMVTLYGFRQAGDPERITWIYVLYAATSFFVVARWKLKACTWGGCLMTQLALAQILVYAWPLESMAWPTSLLVGSTICAAASIVLWQKRRVSVSHVSEVGKSLALYATAASLGAAILLFTTVPSIWNYGVAGRMVWVVALWATLSLINQWPALFAGAQTMLFAATIVGVQSYLATLEWYQALIEPIAEPWVWQAHLVAIAGLSLMWAVLRHVVSGKWLSPSNGLTAKRPAQRNWRAAASALLNPSFPAADFWMVGITGLACIGLTVWAAFPAIFIEHGWRNSPLFGLQFAHAAGLGSWVLLFTVTSTLALYHRGGFPRAKYGVLVFAAIGVALLAAQWEPSHGVTSAWRWLSAGSFALISGFLWLQGRRKAIIQTGSAESWRTGHPTYQFYRSSTFIMFVLPVVVLTATFDFALSQGSAMVAPEVSNFWLRLSLLGPCVLIVVTLIGYAILDRGTTYLLAAAGLLCASMTLVEVCLLNRTHRQVSAELGIWLVQLNVILVMAIAGGWRTIQLALVDSAPPDLPRWPVQAARTALGAVLLLASVMLWLVPQSISPIVTQAGSAWGVAAFLLTAGSFVIAKRDDAQPAIKLRLLPVIVAIAIACALAPWDTGTWLCFHTLLAGLSLAGWVEWWIASRELQLLLGSGWRESFDTAATKSAEDTAQICHDLSCVQCSYNLRGLQPSGRCPECHALIADSVGSALERLSPQWAGEFRRLRARTTAGILAGTVLISAFALRALLNDPGRPWWSSAALLVAAALCMSFAAWGLASRFAYVAAVEVLLGTTGWWWVQHWPRARIAEVGDFFELVHINLIGLAAAGVAWMWLERSFIHQRTLQRSGRRVIPFHHSAAVLSVAVFCGVAGIELYGAFVLTPVRDSVFLTWLAWGAIAALNVACVARPAFRYATANLYVLGLASLAILTADLEMQLSTLAWSLSLALAGFVLLTSVGWRLVQSFKPDWSPVREAERWLMHANVMLMWAAMVLAGYTSFTYPDFGIRMLVVLPALACAASAWLTSVGSQRQSMQTAGLSFLSAGGVLFSLSWVPPGIHGSGLLRAVALFAAVSALIPVFGWVAGRVINQSSIAAAICHVGYGLVVVAVSALVFVSRWEIISLLNRTALPLTDAATIAMIASQGLLIITSIVFALRPVLDPFRVVEAARGLYVYVGEALAAVLALHVRASIPWLFSGVITQYWPILVMGLAFAAVSVGEAFRRRGLHFLAQPLGRTGLFLPAVTALEFFLSASRTPFWVVLTSGGAFYVVLAGLRRSETLAVVGGICLTGALWYFLHQVPELGIAQHPQLWFIPPALAVLIAAHLNRSHLSEEQQGTLRYACLIVIYLSSAADIFLVGVAKAPWLPLVLGGLSVGGILFGIGYRIRSFLQLGTGFLCLSLLTIIWHAATNLGWTWVWYVAGIGLGIAIIAVFALFEKKRNEMTAIIENVRTWSK